MLTYKHENTVAWTDDGRRIGHDAAIARYELRITFGGLPWGSIDFPRGSTLQTVRERTVTLAAGLQGTAGSDGAENPWRFQLIGYEPEIGHGIAVRGWSGSGPMIDIKA